MVNYEGERMGIMGLESLAEEFIKTGDETYFNLLWEGVKPFSIKMGKKFMTIPYEDKESIAMEVLFRCVSKLQNNTGFDFKKGKLLTYYGRALYGEFICWLEKCNTYKQKVNTEAYSLEKMEEDIGYIPATAKDNFNMNIFLSDCQLLDIEAKFILLLDEGYNKREIMARMKLKKDDYNSLLDTVREKIRNNYLIERV